MKLIKSVILVFWVFVISVQIGSSQDGLPAFIISNSKGKSVKKLTIRFADAACGADSIAKYDANLGGYSFDCFPQSRTAIFFEAPGYNTQVLTMGKSELGGTIKVKLQKKGPQTIKIDDTDYKYWELHNVIYLKEKEGKAFKLKLLIDSLGLFESPYYGKNYYEHEDKIDFNAWNDSFLTEFRKSGYTLIAAPVILLFKERTKDDKKFRPTNKLLPLPNILEFEENKKPKQADLQAFGIEEIFVYANQYSASSPKAYQSMNPGLGLQVLTLVNSLNQLYPDTKIKCLDISKWYSLDLNETEEKDSAEN